MEKQSHSGAKGWLTLAAFLAVMVLLIALLNTFYIKTDTVSFLTMQELKTRDDIDLAIIGSSLVREGFNPQLITERTGLTAFNVTIPAAGAQTLVTLTEMLYDKNTPEVALLIVDPYYFTTTTEMNEAYCRFIPQINTFPRFVDYYVSLSSQDKLWFDHLLYFKEMIPTEWNDILKTFTLRTNPAKYFETHEAILEENKFYMGSGYVRSVVDTDVDALLAEESIRTSVMERGAIPEPYVEKRLLKIRDLAAAHNTRLIVLFFPSMSAWPLSEDGFVEVKEDATAYMQSHGMEVYDLQCMKPEYLARLDPYYIDWEHINATGSDILSESLSVLLNRLLAGEDVSDMFYASQEEYLASLDFITNIWADHEIGETTDTYIVRANIGQAAKAQYRFTLLEEDGSETLLRDYDPDPTFTVDRLTYFSRIIRMYAKTEAEPDHIFTAKIQSW